ncbi:MAG: ArsR/SmtB family transcription factor [Planctomycetaceae bacterium]|jgi:ArsR family transcriptional regulator
MSDSELDPTPHDHDHPHDPTLQAADVVACQRAAAIFRAMGDPNRLRLLSLLAQRELCVSELTVILGDNLPAVSQRLKSLRSDRIVIARREGKHIFYRLADQHIRELMNNGLEHAREEGH